MTIWPTYRTLQAIAQREFADVVVSATILMLPTDDPLKLRLDISDGSLLDIYLSVSGRYSYHWERWLTPSNDIYRHDNAPHGRWQYVATFPKHFHNGSETNVVASTINDTPAEALREFLIFVRHKLLKD